MGTNRCQQGLSLVLEKSGKKPRVIKAREALELVIIIIGNEASEM